MAHPSSGFERSEWLDWVLTTSVPLCRLDASGHIIPAGSAAIIVRDGRKFLVSVAHAVPPDDDRCMAYMRAASGGGSELYKVGRFNYLAKISEERSFTCLDFGFVEVDPTFDPVYQQRTRFATSNERPRHVFDYSDVSPSADAIEYAFSGRIGPELHGEDTATTTACYAGLRYLHTDGPHSVFRLPARHPGHGAFKGCSGAPIVDSSRKLAAILVGGCEKTNSVFGISLGRYLYGIEGICKFGEGA